MIVASGGRACAVQADVSEEAGATALVKAATSEYGRLDILVNNAGITRDNVIMLMKPQDFDDVLQTNLRSAWLCSRMAVRSMMRKRYGRIVNVSSISGLLGPGRPDELQRQQGRSHRTDQSTRQRSRAAQDYGQRGGAWLHPHRT